MRDGILVLNKPRDWTSHDCVALCRRVLRLKGVKKIGHGGTLDPMAEGVLPIFIGQATRIMEYLDLDYKTYRCRVQLGLTSDTQDIWGAIQERRSYEGICQEQVLQALEAFTGVMEQMPPMYSAVRIGGKHLYEYARSGKAQEQELLDKIRPRRVHIREITLLDMDPARGEFSFAVECSKGTYVRTICHELGRRLGCGAVMSGLTRTAVGRIDLTSAVSPEHMKQMEHDPAQLADLEQRLLMPDQPLDYFGKVVMPAHRARYFRQGNSIRLHQVKIDRAPAVAASPLTGAIPCNARGRSYDRIYRVYQQEDGMFLGIGYLDESQGVMKADKIFTALNAPKRIP